MWCALWIALGCGPTESAPKPIDVPLVRMRIVSLSPSMSELLVELGAGPEIVAADSASVELQELSHVPSLGELDLDAVERTLASAPDLVVGLAAPHTRIFATALEERGLAVHLFDPRDADAVLRVTHRLGDLLERPTRAISVAAAQVRTISEFAVRRDGKSRLTVAWLVGCDPLTVVGGSGMAHEVLELAGAENSFHELGVARLQITHEQLAAHTPEVLLDSTVGDDPEACFEFATPVPRIEPTPAALTTMPSLDLSRRVRDIHTILYDSEQRRGP